MLLQSVNQAQTLKSLIAQKTSLSRANFSLLLSVLAYLPVKGEGEKLSAELSELLKDGLSLIQKSYLDHADLNSLCSDAMLNILQLTYDNYQNTTATIKTFTRDYVKESLNQVTLSGLISDDMKMYALDIVFKKAKLEYNTGMIRK